MSTYSHIQNDVARSFFMRSLGGHLGWPWKTSQNLIRSHNTGNGPYLWPPYPFLPPGTWCPVPGGGMPARFLQKVIKFEPRTSHFWWRVGPWNLHQLKDLKKLGQKSPRHFWLNSSPGPRYERQVGQKRDFLAIFRKNHVFGQLGTLISRSWWRVEPKVLGGFLT